MTRVVVTGGHVTAEEDTALVEATKCVVLLTRMDGSSTRVNVKALSEALLAEYDELLARHAPVFVPLRPLPPAQLQRSPPLRLTGLWLRA
ncbi:hypothetical protein [Streptomyces ipomoeae]|uniref:hypothetical protein n=1 Tax=Streptomyces ipomoeae TaxID=103232 RepID=UPI00114766C8|nr:hypothetical protein [Streptomyces ipomoeae]MDX2935558.1 hypothetical protein [Streptomyces ipomoeae]TQE18380.1 hypothetical protein SipoB123_34020 [Streptomyces ipomoeae]